MGPCSLDPPYDIYFGTAEPGSKVTISSEFGGATVKADDKGNWEKKVIFAEAPYDKTFIVTVKDKYGTKKSSSSSPSSPPRAPCASRAGWVAAVRSR